MSDLETTVVADRETTVVEYAGGFNPVHLVNELSSAKNVNLACVILEKQLRLQGFDLLSVKFCDLQDKNPAIRPFGAYPSNISSIATELRSSGGCPISKEAQKRLAPFDAMTIERSTHSDFLSSRFLQELKKMKHSHIAVIPVVFGRGLAVYTIGLNDIRFEGFVREGLINFICNATASLIGQFPVVSKLFEAKLLSSTEARAVLLCSNGQSDDEIGRILNFGAHTVNMLLNKAMQKLEARNRAHLISKALALGEVCNMQNV